FLHAPRHDSAPLPASNDEAARALALVARLEPLGLLAPRAHGRATAGAPAFPPAVRVVDRVHGTTALVRLAPHPTLAAGLADDDVLVLGVADGADGGVALAMQAAQFAGRHTDGDVGAVAALDLDAGAGRARELRAFARHHLDGVHGGADRDEPERHRVACHRLGLGAAHDGAADADLVGRDDVALLAVDVVQQGDVGAAVGIVLDRGDLGGHTLLVTSTVVDDTVAALVAAAPEARRDATAVVAAAALRDGTHQRLLGRGARDVGEIRDGHLSTGGGVRAELLGRHGSLLPLRQAFELLDALPGLQGDDGLLAVRAMAGEAPEALELPTDVDEVDLG